MSPVHLPVGVLHNYLLIIASLTELITVNSLGMMLEPAQLFAAQPIVLQTIASRGFVTLPYTSLFLTQLNQSICTQSRSGWWRLQALLCVMFIVLLDMLKSLNIKRATLLTGGSIFFWFRQMACRKRTKMKLKPQVSRLPFPLWAEPISSEHSTDTNQQETRRLNCTARQLEVKMHEKSAENVVN